MYNPILKGVVATMLAFGVSSASAEKIVIASYGTTASALPFSVASELGYLKEAGITEVIGSDGGGTTIRNLVGSGAIYAEVALGAIAAAVQSGIDLKIVSGNVHRLDFAWITKPTSNIKSLQDLKGKKLGYTNPRSNTQVVTILLLDYLKIAQQDVQLISFGNISSGISMLDRGDIDAMPISEPMISAFGNKYRTLIDTTVLPPMGNAYGVTTPEAAKTKGDTIRKVIIAHRKAVQFINANPEKAAEIFARTFNTGYGVALTAVNSLLASGKTTGIPYWSEGELNLQTMRAATKGLVSVGALKEEPDWSALIDQNFLPADLRR